MDETLAKALKSCAWLRCKSAGKCTFGTRRAQINQVRGGQQSRSARTGLVAVPPGRARNSYRARPSGSERMRCAARKPRITAPGREKLQQGAEQQG